MCDHDYWVNLAMADSSIVANLLLRLNNHPQPPPSLQLHWTIRQPESSSTRASPTTPLSWSASEESKLTETSRSKVTANPKETVTTRNSKSKRKKNLAELREEESLLLNERRNLKNELASLRLSIEKERATNESLKRMKIDFESQQKSNTATTYEVYGKIVCNQTQLVEAVCAPLKVQEIGKQEPTFVLPDLNLLVEEDLSY